MDTINKSNNHLVGGWVGGDKQTNKKHTHQKSNLLSTILISYTLQILDMNSLVPSGVHLLYRGQKNKNKNS